MADVYQRIVQLLDDSQYLAALAKEEDAEKSLAAVRTAGGQAAIKAYRAVEAAHKAEEKALAKTFAANEAYQASLLRLQEQTAGLSGEQRGLNDFIRATEAAMKAGTITAQQYADAQGAIKARQNQITSAAAAAKKGLEATAEGATKGAAGAGAMTAAMGNVRSQLIDIGVQLQGGQNPLTILSQQGPQIAEAFLGTAGSLGTFASAAGSALAVGGSLALALGPLVGVYVELKNAAEDAAATLDHQRQVMGAQVGVLEQVRDAQRKALKAIGADADGKLTDQEIEERWQATKEKTAEILQAQQAVLQASLHQIDESEVKTALANVAEKDRAAILELGNATLKDRTDRLETVNTALNELDGAVQQGIAADKLTAEVARETAEANRVLAERREAAARAANRQREAEAALREEQARIMAVTQAMLAQLRVQEQTYAAFDRLHDAALVRKGDEEAAIALAAQAQRDQLQTAALAAMAAEDDAARKLQIRRELNEGLRAINAQELEDYTALKQKEQEVAEKAAQAEADRRAELLTTGLDQAGSYASSVTSLFGTAADVQAQTAEASVEALKAAREKGDAAEIAAARRRANADKRAALQAWERQQNAAKAEAFINTALAVSKAATVAPPPFNLVAMGAAVAAGLAQEVAIAQAPPPKFTDTPPGGWRPSGAQRTASFAADDTVVAARDPQELVRQAVAAAVDRQMARPPARATRSARTQAPPVARLLTSDLGLTVRGRA